MAEPRFDRALLYPDGLRVSWLDVPGPAAQETLLLSLLVSRTDAALLQLGVKWIRGAADSPIVFAWNSEVRRQTNHPAPQEAISADDGSVVVTFPREWLGDLLNHEERLAQAVVNIDGIDRSDVALDLHLDSSP